MINTKPQVGGAKTKRQISQEEKVRFWQDHIQGWRESGVRQSDYCRERGLKETAFTYWKGKLTQVRSVTPGTLVVSDTSHISLVPVGLKVNVEPSPKPISPQSVVTKPLVVVVDGHYRIEVSGDFESATLGKLVSTLRQL
jgi:hypothetical protein